MTSSTAVFTAFGAFSFFFSAAFLLPRIVAKSEAGMAAAGTAALVFLACMLLAAISSIVGFVIAYRRRASLAPSTKLAGYFPFPLLLCTMIYLTIAIMRDVEDASEPQNATPTETAP